MTTPVVFIYINSLVRVFRVASVDGNGGEMVPPVKEFSIPRTLHVPHEIVRAGRVGIMDVVIAHFICGPVSVIKE